MTWLEGHEEVAPRFVSPWQQVLRDLRYLNTHGVWEDEIEPMWAVSLAEVVGGDPDGERVAYVATKYVIDSMEKDLQDAVALLITLSADYEDEIGGMMTAEAAMTLRVIRRKAQGHIVLGTFHDPGE